MTDFLCWAPDEGINEDEAHVVEASTFQCAAESFAYDVCREDGDMGEVTAFVRRASDNALHVYEIEVEVVPSFFTRNVTKQHVPAVAPVAAPEVASKGAGE